MGERSPTGTPPRTSQGEAETVAGTSSSPAAIADHPGLTGPSLGRYVVLEEVGRGAMGRVLRAYDPKLQREVALKELRAERLGEEGSQRLVAEARAMAKLSHANVVAVYDVDVLADARLVLVMEYVAGVTLRDWLARTRHGWGEVVGRFVEAGRGLAAAHTAGLLHRDFKPANVLVSGSSVKVTDFGLAKAETSSTSDTDESPEELSNSDDLTKTGTVIGTPRYMAPEQHRGQALTAAVDQYAFCVALWEALCGRPPFTGNALESLKALAEQKLEGPPAWPASEVPRVIADAVRRGLAARPEGRWSSMDALLEVLAYDPAKRRNTWLAAGSAVGILGLAAAGWQSWAMSRAERCSGASDQLQGVWDAPRRTEVQAAIVGTGVPFAAATWERTGVELDRYAADWTAMHIEACEATTLRGEQSAEVMDLRMGCLRRAKLEIVAVTQVLIDADAAVVRKAGEVVAGLAPLARCADVEALDADVEPPTAQEADAVEGIRSLVAEASAEHKAGRYAAAQVKVEEAKRRLGGIQYLPVRAEVLLEEGAVLQKLGHYEASVVALREALRLGSELHQWGVMQEAASTLMFVVGGRQQRMEEGLQYRELAQGLAAGDPDREAAAHNYLANIRLGQGKLAEAEEEYRLAVALLEKTLGVDHPRVARSRSSLANALESQGKYADAVAEHRRAVEMVEKALGLGHPNVAGTISNLAIALRGQGKIVDAEAESRRAVALFERTLGADHPDTAAARDALAITLHLQGKIAESESEFRRSLAARVEALGPEHLAVAASRGNLGNALYAQGRYAEAESEQRRALALREKALGKDHPEVAVARSNLAALLQGQRKFADAEVLFRQAQVGYEKSLGADHPKVATAQSNLAVVLAAQGKYAEAEAEYRQALALVERVLNADHPHLALCRTNLAGVLLKKGRVEEALELAEQAWVRDQRDDSVPANKAATAFTLARALWAHKPGREQRARARALAEQALAAYAGAGDRYAGRVAAVRAWLDKHARR